MVIQIGTQIGNWEIISEKFKDDNIYKNTCKCICGNIRNVPTWQLNNNKSKSCGCSNIKGRFKSQCIGNLSKSYYNSFKNSRILKGKTFEDNVTMLYLWELFLLQNKKCAISGIEINLNPKWSQQNNGKNKNLENIQTASIDRIDSSKNYTIDNIQWVHKDVNLMKGRLDTNQFILFCRKINNNTINIIIEEELNYTTKKKW